MYLPVGAEYFCTLIPHATPIILQDCGHFMAIDKPVEAALSIVTFYDEVYNKEKKRKDRKLSK